MHLTKTEKKGKEAKAKLMDQIRACATEYSHIYIFKVRNMRNVLFKDLRVAATGRFFIGKNRVMGLALGKEASSECVEGGAEVASRLRGDVGLFFSNEAPDAVTQLLDAQETWDYARTGNRADMTVVIEADPAGLRNVETGEPLSATIEPQLRDCGMPTRLRGGTVLLTTPSYTICEAGKRLTANQARLLKAMGIKMASFRVAIIGHLFQGNFEEFDNPFVEDDDDDAETPADNDEAMHD